MKQITWNLSALFRGDKAPDIEMKRKIVEKKSYEFIGRWKSRKDYLTDPAVLKKALDEYERWKRYWGCDGDEGYYFMLRTAQDQNDPELKAGFNIIENFAKRIENDIQFFHLQIAGIPPKYQSRFLSYSGMTQYRHFLERIFAESKYLLSEPEERILNLKSATSYANWTKMTAGFLAKEERRVTIHGGGSRIKTFSEISSLMNSRHKGERDSAAKAFNDILKKHVETAEAEINSILHNKKIDDELRGIPRPDLARHISDDIGSEVVDSLLNAVSGRFDIPSRYYRLKAGMLGVRKLRYHERNVEFGILKKKYKYNDAVRLIHRVLDRLDPEFSAILEKFTADGQFDVYPRKGKVSGAFCAHNLISQPTYILLNHTDRLNDVLTLAHELGHGINNELVRKKQNSLNFGTPTSTAEVASTFMEDFVLQELLLDAGYNLRLSLMMMKLNDDISTIFRQVACYRFEQELHREFRQKGYLPKEEIGRLFRKHMASYMGDYVEQSPGSENWWVYWSHIRSFFYVYSYAGGLLISKSLQRSVKDNHGFMKKVKDFLSAGLSDSPKNIFRKLGIDITGKGFWNRGIDEVESLLNETTVLARRLGKIK